MPVHAPWANALWPGVGEGTTKAPMYTLPRGVGIGCLRMLRGIFVWMSRVALSLANTGARPSGVPQKCTANIRDGYELHGCGRKGGGGGMLWGARVLRVCEAGCGVLSKHGDDDDCSYY